MADESIGVEGIRLTRDEAFTLVRDAVAAVASGDSPVSSEVVRAKAFELLGRDSESLSARNFGRILKDAHDGGLLDLRKRGEVFEVTAVDGAVSIADQLAVAEEAATPAKAPTTPAKRGMGVRTAPGRNGRQAAKPAVPAGLLLLGMVDEDAPSEDAPSEDKPKPKPRKSRAKKKAPAAAE